VVIRYSGALTVQTIANEVARLLPLSGPVRVRPQVRGKFILAGQETLFVRGVTYGAFRPDARGREYHEPDIIDRDFAQMAAAGFNAVRIPHTMPPTALLDTAARHGLRVMVGLSAEQYLGFLIDGKKRQGEIADLIRRTVQPVAGHPALLCYALGNEIPASIVRWLGPRRVEWYLERLSDAVRREDPDGLLTYVNYPTTEYLQLPFLDLVSFNVYLETPDRFDAYLAHLHTIAGDRPLLMSEIGLDSLRHGEAEQVRALDWQVRTIFASGCAGGFVFAWTDEWFRGGADVDNWAFGLTRRDRTPKPALETVSRAFAEAPFPRDAPWPRISVVVCTHNGARTLRECLSGLRALEYPNFEVIVVDDGSTDRTEAIARESGMRFISTEQRGLGSARNTGLAAASGEIVAYIDDDATPDPHWLMYLARSFLTTSHAGVGGPNIAPPDDGPIAGCVAKAPGGPVHVLTSDREAEHIPGCNMAFRAECLRAVGGFDPQFRIAGDDVDLCWRLRDRGWTLGFSPAAMVWHHRRNSIRAYWQQQREYGKAEAQLARKWPHRYNGVGHVTWSGSVYGCKSTALLRPPRRIYHGVWGSAPFQSLYERSPAAMWLILTMPEWYLVILLLVAVSALGMLWRPLLGTLPLLALSVGILVMQAGLAATRTLLPNRPASRAVRYQQQILTAVLYLLQPLARLSGRLHYGLAPWRRNGEPGGTLASMRPSVLPRRGRVAVWSKRWEHPEGKLQRIEAGLKAAGANVRRGGDYDRWDLDICVGTLGAARLLAAVEDTGSGVQLTRYRWWPRWSPAALAVTFVFGVLAADAVEDRAFVVAAVLGAISLLLALRACVDCADAVAVIRQTVDREEP